MIEMCLSSHFSFVVCYDSRKRSQSTKSFFKKTIISHQIVNVPEGQKEHSQVRCLNQGRSASFTCTHKCRKLTFLTPVNEKRVFIYRIWPKTHSSWRRASGLKWRKEICRRQQTTGSRRSVGSKDSWLIRAAGPQEHEEQTNCGSCGDPDLDLDPDPHHHQVSSLRWRTGLRTSQTKRCKSFTKSCFNMKNRSSQMKRRPFRSWGTWERTSVAGKTHLWAAFLTKT